MPEILILRDSLLDVVYKAEEAAIARKNNKDLSLETEGEALFEFGKAMMDPREPDLTADETLSNMMVNMLHYARSQGMDVSTLLFRIETNYQAEAPSENKASPADSSQDKSTKYEEIKLLLDAAYKVEEAAVARKNNKDLPLETDGEALFEFGKAMMNHQEPHFTAEETLSDMMVNMLHYARSQGMDVSTLLFRIENNYQAEAPSENKI